MCFCNEKNPMPICEECPLEKRALFQNVSNDPKAQEAFSIPVQVVVIHKPTNKSTSAKVAIKDVRRYALTAVRSFMAEMPMVGERLSSKQDFVIVEFGRSGSVRVSSLETYGEDKEV